jgi:sigma-B regulation protein RsbU (phosphoserine phosphatase)
VKTGQASFINCGHNPPLIKQNGEKFKYVEFDSNIVLGAFENAEINISETYLKSGDTVFIYTDGITEAANKSEELYGEERLFNSINSSEGDSVRSILESVKTDVKNFAQDVAQSDDMTMLIFKYCGNNNFTQKYSGTASKQNYAKFNAWLENTCINNNLDDELKMKLHLIAEELYTNIFSYAYEDNQGDIEVILSKENNMINYTFIDRGVKYNPLERPDPDVTLPPESREQGGLGIFIVKSSVNEINYEYKDGQNILSMKII